MINREYDVENQQKALDFWRLFKPFYERNVLAVDDYSRNFLYSTIDKFLEKSSVLKVKNDNTIAKEFVDYIYKLSQHLPIDDFAELYGKIHNLKTECGEYVKRKNEIEDKCNKSYNLDLQRYIQTYPYHSFKSELKLEDYIVDEKFRKEVENYPFVCQYIGNCKSAVELIEDILKHNKIVTQTNIEKVFENLNIGELVKEKKYYDNWCNCMVGLAISFFAIALLLPCCNYYDISSNDEGLFVKNVSDSIIERVKETHWKETTKKEIVVNGKSIRKDSVSELSKDTELKVNATIDVPSATDAGNNYLETYEVNKPIMTKVIFRSILSLSFLTLMILALNQASRARKNRLLLSKEITEFKYIEGLLQAKNIVDFDRDTNDSISAVIDKMIENHLSGQNNRIGREDHSLSPDISLEGLKLMKDFLEKIIASKK